MNETPKDRLTARGYDFDAKGNTVPIGYGSNNEVFDADPWEWLESRSPDLTLYCPGMASQGSAERGKGRVVVAVAWDVKSESQIWFKSGLLQGQVNDWSTPAGNLPLTCPAHGQLLVPVAWVVDETRSRRSDTANVQCTAPRPVYTKRS